MSFALYQDEKKSQKPAHVYKRVEDVAILEGWPSKISKELLSNLLVSTEDLRLDQMVA
jgi:hypothetical protein